MLVVDSLLDLLFFFLFFLLFFFFLGFGVGSGDVDDVLEAPVVPSFPVGVVGVRVVGWVNWWELTYGPGAGATLGALTDCVIPNLAKSSVS